MMSVVIIPAYRPDETLAQLAGGLLAVRLPDRRG